MLQQESLEISGGSSNQLLQQGQHQGITKAHITNECAAEPKICIFYESDGRKKTANPTNNQELS